jgi:hypothetical protein
MKMAAAGWGSSFIDVAKVYVLNMKKFIELC